MKYLFIIIDDCGTIAHIYADSRKNAIEKYCSWKGRSKEYVKDLCIVKKRKSKEDTE